MTTTLLRRGLRATLQPVRLLGHAAEAVGGHVGGMSVLLWRMTEATVRGRVSLREVVAQTYFIGVKSIPLVCVTGMLSGLVTLTAGRVPVHRLGAAVRAGQRRGHQRHFGAGAGDHRLRTHRPRGGPHHRRTGHYAGFRADRRPLLPGPRPGGGAGRPQADCRDPLDPPAGGVGQHGGALRRSTRSAESILSRIDQGQGTLGKLTTDAALYDNATQAAASVRQAADELARLTADIRAQPEKYVQVSVF